VLNQEIEVAVHRGGGRDDSATCTYRLLFYIYYCVESLYALELLRDIDRYCSCLEEITLRTAQLIHLEVYNLWHGGLEQQ